jgi:hypothetical protein
VEQCEAMVRMISEHVLAGPDEGSRREKCMCIDLAIVGIQLGDRRDVCPDQGCRVAVEVRRMCVDHKVAKASLH